MRGCLTLSVVVGLAVGASSVRAQEAAERLPMPREIVPLGMPRLVSRPVVLPAVVQPMPAYTRVNRYEVWQYYDVDRRGNFRPRVILSPYGDYYLHDGSPYFYTQTRSLSIRSYMIGP